MNFHGIYVGAALLKASCIPRGMHAYVKFRTNTRIPCDRNLSKFLSRNTVSVQHEDFTKRFWGPTAVPPATRSDNLLE